MVERLLVAVSEEEEEIRLQAPALVTEDGDNVWPPWPWPPWDGDDDGDKGGDKKPTNGSRRAHKLAKKLIEFETEIAKASLDLFV